MRQSTKDKYCEKPYYPLQYAPIGMPPPLNISSDLSKVAISSSLCTSILQAGRESPLTKWLLRLGPRTPAQQQVRVMRAMCAFPQTRHRAVCTVIADGSWVVCDVVAYARSCTRVRVCACVHAYSCLILFLRWYPPIHGQFSSNNHHHMVLLQYHCLMSR